MSDVPTLTSATVANYAVLNPLDKGTSTTLSNGNLTPSIGSAAWTSVRSTMPFPTTGKWYAEATCGAIGGGGLILGIGTASASLATYTGADANGWCYYNTGQKINNATAAAYGASYTDNDVIGIAFDADAGTLVFYKNNTSQGTAYSGLTSGTYFVMPSVNASSWSLNFGQRPFSYTPPTGFVRLNTYNLPDSTIKKGNTVMDATLYTGVDGVAGSVVNAAGFKPDLVWAKSRAAAGNHVLADSVRGVNRTLYSNGTSAEVNNATELTAFNSNGFSFGTSGDWSNGTHVGWQWQAGQGTNTSNTSGSITSTVSVNATAGFSILTFNAGANGNKTVGHGLGVKPAMFVFKDRSTGNWLVWHQSLSSQTQSYLLLSSTAASANDSRLWANTAPTPTLLSFETGYTFNTSASCLAYCWAEIAGFSKFTSYVGNGSTDGPFVFLGFRPKFILIKNTTTAGYSWQILDTARNTYNVMNAQLFPNSSAAEDTTNVLVDYLSNGFKLRNGDGAQNLNSNTYIVAAWAENPFKNSNAR
jgi:hypothetical protein